MQMLLNSLFQSFFLVSLSMLDITLYSYVNFFAMLQILHKCENLHPLVLLGMIPKLKRIAVGLLMVIDFAVIIMALACLFIDLVLNGLSFSGNEGGPRPQTPGASLEETAITVLAVVM